MKSDIKVGHQGPKFVLWCWFVYLGYCLPLCDLRGFPGGSVSKESACNAGDLGMIPGLGRSMEDGMAIHSSVLAWKISWREEPGGLQSMGSQRVGHH